MMRVSFLLFCVLVLCGLGGCSSDHSSYRFTLKGELDNIKEGKVYIAVFGEGMKAPIDSAEIVDGKFELKGETATPKRFAITLNQRTIVCFLDGKDLFLKGVLKPHCLTGSPANDLEVEYNRMLKEKIDLEQDSLLREYRIAVEEGNQKLGDDLMTHILQLDDVRYQLTYDFVSKHPDNIFSAYAAETVLYGRYEQGKAIYDVLRPEVQQSSFGLELKQRVDDLALAATGNVCPDFTVTDSEGKEMTMSSLLKTTFANKLVVVDFWASWCGPCRQEMKNLMEQYKEFHEQGVCFMSVSLDDSETKWRKAYEEENFPWLNTWDKGGWNNSAVRKALGFRQIPYIIVLDREGKVVAKNVRRNTLREKIVEQLKL